MSSLHHAGVMREIGLWVPLGVTHRPSHFQGWQTFPVQGRKSSHGVIVLTGDKIAVGPLPGSLPKSSRVRAAANRTVAVGLAGVDDALDTILLRRA